MRDDGHLPSASWPAGPVAGRDDRGDEAQGMAARSRPAPVQGIAAQSRVAPVQDGASALPSGGPVTGGVPPVDIRQGQDGHRAPPAPDAIASGAVPGGIADAASRLGAEPALFDRVSSADCAPCIPGRPLGWPRRVAIVHYWLVTMRGGERVVEQLLRLFPQADVFTHVYAPDAVSDLIRARRVTETFIGRLPGARTHYQKYLPLMPMALEELDLSGYDLVISSESGPAKGVIVPPDAVHLCYVHSPMRYLWDHYHQYKASAGRLTRALMPWMFHRLRGWDVASARRVDRLVANSRFIQGRIAKSWGREASVVHPPVEVDLFTPAPPGEVTNRFLWVGQMTPYKRADVALDAFNALGLPLLMVGTGEMAGELRRRAGPNVEIVERLDFGQLRRAYATCRALVFTAEEDFGIVPVEAMAAGRPVIAYGRGGVLDSIVPGETGLFFAEQNAASLAAAVRAFEAWVAGFDPATAVAQARRFAPDRFAAGIMAALAA